MKLDGESTVLHPIHKPSHLQHENAVMEPIKHEPVKKIAGIKRDEHFHEDEERGLITVPLLSGLRERDSSDYYQNKEEGKGDKMDRNMADLNTFTRKTVVDFDFSKADGSSGAGSDCNEIRELCMDRGVITADKILYEVKGDFHHRNVAHLENEVGVRLVKENTEKDSSISDVLESPEGCKPVHSIGRSSDEQLVQPVNDVITSENCPHDSSPSRVNEAEKQSEVPRDESIAGSSDPINKTEEIQKSGKEAARDSNIICVQSTLCSNDEAGTVTDEKAATSEANAAPYSSRVESGAITFNFSANTATPSERFFSLSNGESSFSILAGSPSGVVPYSGNVSLRSESSTTSTRSFAFPVMQNEWISSPVRMIEADRKRHRKKSVWRQVFCCKS